MKRVSKLLSIAATSLALTGTALADDPPAGGDGGGGDAGSGSGAGGGATAPAPTDGGGVAAGMFTKENWPTASIDRPLSAAKGMIEIAPIFNYAHAKDAMGNSSDGTGASVVGRYGISDKLEALFGYSGIRFSPGGFEAKGDLQVGAGIMAVAGGAGGKLDIEPKAAFDYNLVLETAAIAVGADIRYKVTPKIFLGTPINKPGLVITVKGIDILGTTIAPIFFELPFAVGFQATPQLAIQVNTLLAHFKINDSGGANTFVGADFIPLNADILYGLSNKMDIRINLNLGDLKTIGDTNAIGVNAGVNVRL